MMEGDALVRADLNLNPDDLDDAAWVAAVQQALWLEYYRANLIGRLFSSKE